MLYMFLQLIFFFFFKQKTAYEIVSGDWSSDVCSSDLSAAPAPERATLEKSAFLLVLSGPQVGELHKLKPDQPTVIGRGEADLRIDDDGVSRKHCSIQPRGRGALVVDLGSANGTFVGGERIRERLLATDDHFQIGVSTTLKFTIADDLEAAVQRRMA